MDGLEGETEFLLPDTGANAKLSTDERTMNSDSSMPVHTQQFAYWTQRNHSHVSIGQKHSILARDRC